MSALPDALSHRIQEAHTMTLQSIQLIPLCIQSFIVEITPFKGRPQSAETLEAASHIVRIYTGKLQALDLSLSQSQAVHLLGEAYRSIV
jgi:hypothetical protein